MRRILAILLAGVLVLAAAWALFQLPGHLTIEIGDTTIEAALSVLILGAILLFLLLYVALRLLAGLIGLPGMTGRWHKARQAAAGDRAVTQTLLALAAGDKSDARREAHRARRLLGDTPQTLLLAAEAGRAAGRDDEAEMAFRALSERPDAAFLGYRGLLRQAIGREDWTEAAALARQAERAHPGAAWLREERTHLAVRAGNWAEALELADARTPKAALGAAAAEAEPDQARALQLAKRSWKDDPALPAAALAYARRLREAGREKRAQSVLEHSWTLSPNPALAAFALALVDDKLERAKAAQVLAAKNPEHAESRLLLARTALDAGLTGEARHQAEAAREAGVNERRLWLLLAEIEEAEGGSTEAGRRAQRDALRRAAVADADPSWVCGTCHTPHAVWQPACRSCLAVGTVRWGEHHPAVTALPALT